MVITLIGYRGTGKSAVGAALASRLRWGWCDADEQIEREAGMSIQEIFLQQQETGFRDIERQVMHRLLTGERPVQAHGLVIASGGGAVLNAETRQEMRAAGPVVWLTASVETILSRIASDMRSRQRRPNLTNLGGRDEIESVLREREPLYRACADAMVDTSERSLDEIVDQILRELGPPLQEGAGG